jgi:NAD+ diphosphatase
MIQDIYPSKLRIEYKNYAIEGEDNLLFFNNEGKILLGNKDGIPSFLAAAEVSSDYRSVYLFSLDEKRYFLALDAEAVDLPGLEYYTIREVRDKFVGKEVFAVFTAYHLWKWYSDNIFCGKCAERLELSDKERALVCPKCGNVIYPRINPAVIVGVTKEDSLLITRYRTGFAHNALVAGFAEIGETLEETVAREVMEETGVKVKNIRYYKSQPWGLAQDILVGFYCDADGDAEIHMDEGELKYAEWVKREDIVLQPNNYSLTNEMMKVFREQKKSGQK